MVHRIWFRCPVEPFSAVHFFSHTVAGNNENFFPMLCQLNPDFGNGRPHCRFHGILQYISHQCRDVKHFKACFPGQFSCYREIYLFLFRQVEIVIQDNIKHIVSRVDFQLKLVLYVPNGIYVLPDFFRLFLTGQFPENAHMIHQVMPETPHGFRLPQLIIVLLLLHLHKKPQFPVLSVRQYISNGEAKRQKNGINRPHYADKKHRIAI